MSKILSTFGANRRIKYNKKKEWLTGGALNKYREDRYLIIDLLKMITARDDETLKTNSERP